MRTLALYISIPVLVTLIATCSQGNFSGNGSNPNSKKPCASGDPKCKPTVPGKSDNLIADDGNGLCLKKAPSIDFILVMDVSGSMKPQSARVSAAFSQLATNLSNISIEGLGKVPSVRFGLIAFEDVIQYESSMISDSSQVSTLISDKFKAIYLGGDASEGGLMAAAKGLSLARNNNDSIKVMFIVTDAFAHDGTPLGAPHGIRNYSPKDVNSILAEPDMKMTFIYSATPQSGGNRSPNPQPPFPNAVDQWSDIRRTAGESAGHPPLGRDFEVATFTSEQVSDAIPQDIGSQLRKCK
jgi:hypothetical protein